MYLSVALFFLVLSPLASWRWKSGTTDPLEPSSDELANAEAALLGSTDAVMETEPDQEAAAKPKRRTRKRPAKASQTEDATPTVEAETADGATAGEEEPAAEEKPKRRRTRSAAGGTRSKPASRTRSRKKSASVGAETADREGDAPDAPEAADTEQPPAVEPPVQEVPRTPPSPNAYAESSDPGELERTAPPPASEETDRPKRRGWWQRWV